MLVFVGGQTLFVEHMRQVLPVAVVVRVPTARMRRLRFVVKKVELWTCWGYGFVLYTEFLCWYFFP